MKWVVRRKARKVCIGCYKHIEHNSNYFYDGEDYWHHNCWSNFKKRVRCI